MLGHFEGAETLSDDIQLSSEAAARAIQPLAEALGMPLNDTASGIVDLANEKMAQALRVISIQRGFDPADFTLDLLRWRGRSSSLLSCAIARDEARSGARVCRHVFRTRHANGQTRPRLYTSDLSALCGDQRHNALIRHPIPER